jgi:bifunctional non-homologous end joining protein LigD
MNVRVRAGRRTIEITHADRVLFGSGVTKLELARYYTAAAPRMLPHVRDRPLTVQSYPAGVQRPGYMWKSIPEHFPDWIHRVEVPKAGGTVVHPLADNADTLVYLANQNGVVLHTWTSRADRIDRPDQLIIDLDPSNRRFAEVRAAARAAGALLRDRGLHPFVKTTGSRGLHVVCPLRRTADHQTVLAFARQVADELAAANPRRLTTEQRKNARGERVYLDVARNAYAQTAVAPYSVRAAPQAPIAVPLHWHELDDRRLTPDRWTVRTVGDRLTGEDPWEAMRRSARGLPRAWGP